MSKSPKKASSSISVSYVKTPDGTPSPLVIKDRAPSVLGKSQGDHVTAYRLIEEALYNALSDLTDEEVFGLSSMSNRNSLRDKRSKLYNFVSILGSLENPENTKILYDVIDGMLAEYQKKRHKKTTLRVDTRSAQQNDDLDARSLSGVLGGIDASYKFNGELLRDFFTEASRYLMTFYNKIPLTAFFAIEGFKAPPGEGAAVSKSIRDIKQKIEEARRIAKDSPALTTKLNREIMPLVLSLIHYPQITDKGDKKAKDILGEHRGFTLTNGAKKTAKARDNDGNKLTYVLARHLHLTFAAFPQMPKIFDTKGLVSSFVSAFIKDERTGWPGYNNPAQISGAVLDSLAAMQKAATENHYTNRKKYTDELLSSDDEEEVTTPSPRAAAGASISRLSLSLEERRELEELRRFKAEIDAGVESGKITIAPGVKISPVTSSALAGPGKPKMESLDL